jgi:hypothetical protein
MVAVRLVYICVLGKIVLHFMPGLRNRNPVLPLVPLKGNMSVCLRWVKLLSVFVRFLPLLDSHSMALLLCFRIVIVLSSLLRVPPSNVNLSTFLFVNTIFVI